MVSPVSPRADVADERRVLLPSLLDEMGVLPMNKHGLVEAIRFWFAEMVLEWVICILPRNEEGQRCRTYLLGYFKYTLFGWKSETNDNA